MNAPKSKDNMSWTVNLEKFFGYKNSIPEHVLLSRRDEALEMYNNIGVGKILSDIYMSIVEPPKGAFKQISLYRALLKRAGLLIMALQDCNESFMKEIDRLGAGIGDQGRKRWTQEEDELLIEAATDGTKNIIDLSKAFGRTPGAIQSRITKLVGIKRLSAEVAGRFIGTINGEFVEGDIDGTLRKE